MNKVEYSEKDKRRVKWSKKKNKKKDQYNLDNDPQWTRDKDNFSLDSYEDEWDNEEC